MTEVAKETWFRTWPAKSGQPNARLIVFPHAGVGASLCNGWSESLPEGVELMAVQLPGRENRVQEPPLENFEPLIEALYHILPNFLDLPMGLFGYSFGGTLSFELARGMVAYGKPPCHLFVGAVMAPHVDRNLPVISQLPDEEFIGQLQAHFGGIPPQIAGEAELLKLMLPAMRADMHAIESYDYVAGDPLPCPITALGGSDDPVGDMAGLNAWAEQTSDQFRHRIFAGDHFFIRQRHAQVMRYIGEQLEQHVAALA